jgi:hypothetical protein
LESGPEQQWIEKSLTEIIDTTKTDGDKLTKQCMDLEADEKQLTEKIRRKQTDLERNMKRLASLQNVRPAFMDVSIYTLVKRKSRCIERASYRKLALKHPSFLLPSLLLLQLVARIVKRREQFMDTV